MSYKTIKTKMNNLSGGEIAKNVKWQMEQFFDLCKRYYVMHSSVIDNLDESSRNILAKYKGDYEEELKEKKPSVGIKEKLDIEFLWIIYKNKFSGDNEKIIEQNFTEEYVFNDKPSLKNIFQDKQLSENEKALFRYSLSDLYQWAMNLEKFSMEKLNLDGLHNSMGILQKSLEQTSYSEEYCVNEIITDSVLDTMEAYLEVENYPAVLFWITNIRRALYDGSINSYTPKAGNSTVFFKHCYNYNYTKLQKKYETYKNMLDDYQSRKKVLGKL